MSELLKIEIEIKSIDQMRYSTVGDYYYKEDGTLKFEIADSGNELYNKMVLIHELVEEALTKQLGITEQSIMDFDNLYEAERLQGIHNTEQEPGFDPRAPYHREHAIATTIEMQMCTHANIPWAKYSNDINSL